MECQIIYRDDCYAIGYKVQKEYMEWMITSHFRMAKILRILRDRLKNAMVDFRDAMG